MSALLYALGLVCFTVGCVGAAILAHWLRTKACPHCGERIDRAETLCQHCGRRARVYRRLYSTTK
jgi:predicted amidophosphoribosyltransferase